MKMVSVLMKMNVNQIHVLMVKVVLIPWDLSLAKNVLKVLFRILMDFVKILMSVKRILALEGALTPMDLLFVIVLKVLRKMANFAKVRKLEFFLLSLKLRSAEILHIFSYFRY